MTRLNSGQLINLGYDLASYDRDLRQKTGCSLAQIAAGAMGVPGYCSGMAAPPVAVVRVTSGKGVIAGFAEAVNSIAAYLGFRSFITADTDVSGLAEAVRRGAGVILMADDNRFVALNITSGRMVDNDDATARGYVFALSRMAGGLKGKSVLVIGAGRLGSRAISVIKRNGADVYVFDTDLDKSEAMAAAYGSIPEEKLDQALERHRIIFDASPACGIIKAEHLRENTIIAAPGIPCGLDEGAFAAAWGRTVHDPLQIGVSAMLLGAVYGKNNY